MIEKMGGLFVVYGYCLQFTRYQGSVCFTVDGGGWFSAQRVASSFGWIYSTVSFF